MRARWFFYGVCLLVAFGFVYGILQLFETRFARGDIYPPYSTLRSDPLGAKAFYESLARLDTLQVSRNEREFAQFAADKEATLFLIGADGLSGEERAIERLEQFVQNGGRLVVAFYPQTTESNFSEPKKEKTARSPTPSPTASPNETAIRFLSTADMVKRWRFKFATKEQLLETDAEVAGRSGGDAKISWHSALFFKDFASAWENVYHVGESAVIIQRSLGKGTIVLMGDSYLLSNEAMLRERHAPFLAWLVGPHRHVVFDEVHLGIRENPGVSTLMRRYRLGGLIVGLIILAVLVIWKNAARIVPANGEQAAEDEVAIGKDSFAGFVNLLRRNIAPRELLRTCVEEWEKFLPGQSAAATAQAARARRVLEEAETRSDDAAKYQEISRAITTRWKRTA